MKPLEPKQCCEMLFGLFSLKQIKCEIKKEKIKKKLKEMEKDF